MVRASALYLVIIIALVIGVICAALVAAASMYNLQYQRKFRSDRIHTNLASGVNFVLASVDENFAEPKKISLFGNEVDSVQIRSFSWGAYDVGTVSAYIQNDTLSSAFSIAGIIDSSKWSSLYLTDDDRPLSVSGKTAIKGDVYLPKAGIKEAYINNTAYEGDSKIISGHQFISSKTLPGLNTSKVEMIEREFSAFHQKFTGILKVDSLKNSFFYPVKSLDISATPIIEQIYLGGHLILYSDSIITIENTAHLENILVFAKSIRIKRGFRGNCQLFARDSITVGQDCLFTYPSCIALLKNEEKKAGQPSRITIGDGTVFNGIIFSHEKEESKIKMIIAVGTKVTVIGEIYSAGTVLLKDNFTMKGSLSTTRFLYQSAYQSYENYLINAQLDGPGLSPYYLRSPVTGTNSAKRKILQWLERR